MIYKTLEDLNRVIALGKPQAVIDKFTQSYLSGVAVAPYLAAENEYSTLQAQEDQPDVEAVLDPESGEVITEGYSPNQLRDDRIEALAAEFPYLATEDQERPELELDYNLVQEQLRTYAKAKRNEIVEKLLVTTQSGKVFDADEISQGRIARAILTAQITGKTETRWGMGDNTTQTVTLDEMQEALALGMNAQGELWFT